MIVKTFYGNEHFDVFDPDHMIDGIAYNYTSNIACEFNPQSVRMQDYLARSLDPQNKQVICELVGNLPDTYAKVAEMERRAR